MDLQHPDRRKKSPRKAIVIILSVLLAIVAIACIFDGVGASQLRRAMNGARAIGGPVMLDELLAARKQWPDNKNGANVMLGIQARLSTQEIQNAKVPVWEFTPGLGRRWADETDRKVHEFLGSMSKELATIDTLKQYDGGAFLLKFDPCPMITLLPHLSPLRQASKLKYLQTLDRAMAGDTTRLVDDVTLMLRIADLVRDEPALISMLVRIAVARGSLYAVEQVCGISNVDPAALRELQDMLGKLDEGNRRIALGMRSERAMFIGTLDYLRATGNEVSELTTSPALRLRKFPGTRGLLMHDEAEGITLYNRLVTGAEQSRTLAEARAVDLEIGKLGITSMFSRMWVSSFTRAISLDTQLNAEARCAAAGLAAELFRLNTGRFPTRLDELVPKYIDRVPTDPFKPDQPLKLHTAADRIIVYSVGEDEQDGGGDVRRYGKEGLDNGFILLTPATRNQPPLPTETQPLKERPRAKAVK